MLAILSFCNFHDITDRYEIFVALRDLGVTSRDRTEIYTLRDKNYQRLRSEYTTPAAHEKFCSASRSQFFFIKTKRKGVPIVAGSDTEKQPEKIEAFGNVLGVLLFCERKIDDVRWGSFLFDMGVKSESVSALNAQAAQVRRSLSAEHGSPQRAPEICAKATNNFSAPDFIRP
jgi:hypothetical protein